MNKPKWFKNYKSFIRQDLAVTKYGFYTDYQKRKIYDTSNKIAKHDYRFEDPDKLKNFINKVLKSHWIKQFTQTGLDTDIIISPHVKGGAISRGEHIKFSKSNKKSWSKGLSIHEICHVIIRNEFIEEGKCAEYFQQNPVPSPHGKLFARMFLDGITYFLGKDVGCNLEEAYKQHGVLYTFDDQDWVLGD